MSPTFTSERRLLIEVRNLSLHLNVPSYRAWTLRDQFVNWTRPSNPANSTDANELGILNNISFAVREGDRIGVLGVNGVGKSTLCRCLIGTYNPTAGWIRRYGRIRGVFDTAVGVYPELTGRENARLLMHFLYPEVADRHEQLMAEALDFSELGKFLDMPYRIYSNGMQARLCLSLISCLHSEVLILDEVFDGADRFFREKISARILSIIAKSGAVIFVSHATEQILQVCNRVLVLNRGRLVFDGPVHDGLNIYAGMTTHTDPSNEGLKEIQP